MPPSSVQELEPSSHQDWEVPSDRSSTVHPVSALYEVVQVSDVPSASVQEPEPSSHQTFSLPSL